MQRSLHMVRQVVVKLILWKVLLMMKILNH